MRAGSKKQVKLLHAKATYDTVNHYTLLDKLEYYGFRGIVLEWFRNVFDSEDDYRTGCRNVSHCQQQSYSGLRSPGRSNSTFS